jgi:hypothetical protein
MGEEKVIEKTTKNNKKFKKFKPRKKTGEIESNLIENLQERYTDVSSLRNSHTAT